VAPLANVTPGPRDLAGFYQGTDDAGDLRNIDLTTLPNGTYDLRLIVHGGGAEKSTHARFRLESNLKIGQFSFSEQDLSLPVNGIPLTVTRTYNSLNSRVGDFGYSWSMALNSMDVQLDDQRQTVTLGSDRAPFADDEEDNSGLPRQVSVRTGGGWDVTLTLPDGRRTTFAFGYDGVWPTLYAKWTAPPDVHATLEMIGDKEIVFGGDGLATPIWADSDFATGKAPFDNHDIQGWLLTTQDGTVYHIERGLADDFVYTEEPGVYVNARAYGPPKLTSIVQKSGDRIDISDNGLTHYPPGSTNATRSIYFDRDSHSRITALHDMISGSNGLPSVKYVYNQDSGNLIQVLKLVDRTAGTYLTNKYHYDNANFPHFITSMENASGVPLIRNLYDDSGRLIGIVDASGRTNSFVHDPSSRVETVYDRKGVPTTFAYDFRGNVTNSIDPYGATNSFSYDDNGALTSHTDPLGHTTSYSNDSSGNVLSVTLPYPLGANPALYTTRCTYDTNGNQTSVTLPSGGMLTNLFDASGNLLETRDRAGNLIEHTDYDPVTGLPVAEGDCFGTNTFAYDPAGNAIRFTNSLHQVIGSSYDPNGQLSTMTNNGAVSSFNYDALGRETLSDFGQGITLSNSFSSDQDWTSVDAPTVGHMERQFDDQNRLAGWKTVNGATPGYAYDESGRMQYETNSIGAVTYYVYDFVGRVAAVTNLVTGAGSAFKYDLAGQRVAQTNAFGEVTGYDYYPDGSLKAMTNASGTNVWLYSDSGSSCSSCSTLTTNTVTDPLGRIAMDVRNENGLPLQMIFASGTNSLTTGTTYLPEMDSPDQEAADYPASVTDEGGRTRSYTYTDFGQLLTASDLGGNLWTNQYDPDSGALTNVLSPTGETLSYTFDSLDNVKTIRYGDGHYLTNFYNEANRVSSNALPSGAILSFSYDEAGRLTNRTSSGGENASFGYNLNDAVTIMTDNTGSTTNLYDPAGRLWGIDYPSGASVRYRLDMLGRITAITNKAIASGTAYITRYQYDEVGNITNIVDPFNASTSLIYDRVGRRTKRTFPNGVVTTWDYDWRDRVTNIVHKVGSTVLASVTYVRAPGGEPTKITREDGSYVMLGYDAALRLTDEAYYNSSDVLQTTNSYAYDASGNRIRFVRGAITLTNSVAPGYRITQVKNAANGTTAETYAYDNGGRVTDITRDSATLNFGYNTSDQVTAVTNGATWVTYTHDANGRRTVSTNSMGTVRRLLVGPTPGTDLESPQLIADANGTFQQGYVYLGYSPLMRFSTSGAAAYYLEDGMGSEIGYAPAVSPTTANTTTLFYDGFGNGRATNGPAPTFASEIGGDFRFQGGWFESLSGFHNFRAREYDSRMGRFTSRDPDEAEALKPETRHLYAFGNSNPCLFSDPSGTESLIEINIVSLIQNSLQTMRQVGVSYAKQRVQSAIFDAFVNVASAQLGQLSPEFNAVLKVLRASSIEEAAQKLEKKILGQLCKVPAVRDVLYIEPSINGKGDAVHNGLNCKHHTGKSSPESFFKRGKGRPDFVLSETQPTDIQGRSAIVVGEIKVSGNRFYKNYVQPGGKKKQLDAICNFASKHVVTDTAVFLTVWKGDKGNWKILRKELLRKTVARHTMLILMSATKK
jgi:RHS repeat-associated protein